MAVVDAPPTEIAASRRVEVKAPTSKPVKYWAVIGAVFLGLQIYVFGRWITGDNFERVPRGSSEIPGYMQAVMTTMQIVAPIGMVGFAYFFLYRPWRRDGRIGLDGILTIVAINVWFQDPFVNYTQAFATYNTGYFNRGSWACEVPGWMSPNGCNFAEPLLWTGPAYVWGMIGGIIICNKVMERVKARRPQTGTFGMILTAYAFFLFFDLIFESFFLMLGVYTYPGAHDGWNIFNGRYFQYPVYEAIFWGATWAGFACVRYFKNDRGQTVAERGIDELNASPRQKSFIRYLSVLGIFSVIFLSYNVVWAYISLNQSDWPTDITDRSYFTSQICGEGTDYACPSEDNPIPTSGTGYIDRDGTFVPANS